MSEGSKKGDSKKNDANPDASKKDLTGILELSALMPPQSAEELLSQDPFAVNEMPMVEQISDFESIDQIGMMDHAPETHDEVDFDLSEDFAISEPNPPDEQALDFSVAPSDESLPAPTPEAPLPAIDDFPTLEAPPVPTKTDTSTTGFSYANPDALSTSEHEDPFADHPKSKPLADSTQSGFEGIKNYSERARETTFQPNAKNPFHLWMAGNFDPFARDKLLLFITENPMGLNSSELDRQINAGRVLLPRISEFAGIKLIQDLRDSGLSFKLNPSSRDEDEVLPQASALRLQYEPDAEAESQAPIIVLPAGAVDPNLWQAFDSIQMVQFLKAEIIEVERSEIFQELLTRMTTSLKNKARLKGASAIGALEHQLKPLRLPSHYQLELKANLLKKL